MDTVGKIHSFQSLGAVDGPGLRCVVFMQGCPLRCIYCHNPDAQSFAGGEEYTPEKMAVMIEKENIKNKEKGKKSFMEKMGEAQMIQSGKDPEEIKRIMAENKGESYTPPEKKSQREIKEEQRRKLNEARKRMAEKYGE